MKIHLLLFLLLSLTSTLFSQSSDPKEYAETIDDPYIFKARSSYATSPAYQFATSTIQTYQVNVNDAGENMIGDAANETSIAINPTDPNHMIIGWRQFASIASNFREAGQAYTLDGGNTWINPEPIEAGIFRSDPVIDVDLEGNFYYNSLSSTTGEFVCTVFKSAADNGWDEGTYAYGGDKQWMAIDKTGGPTTGNIYAFWKSALSAWPPKGFTRSLNNGDSYEECDPLPDDLTRGTMAIGPDGELYICGGIAGSHMVARSSNAGATGEPMTWDFSTYVDLGGEMSLYDGPNPSGMLGQVWITVDHSDGPSRGNVYLLSTVRSNTSGDNADIIFSSSTDGGQNWSPAVKINDDNVIWNWQWFGTISVAPNGRIDVAWVDTRDDPGGFKSRLYFSHSKDAGQSWSANEALSDAFDPHVGFPSQNKIGDYYQMISDNDAAHLAWAATFNGEQDAFYSRITVEEPATTIVTPAINKFNISPNPSSDFFNIDLNTTVVNGSISVYNNLGQLLKKEKIAGIENLRLDLNGQAPGIYFVELSTAEGKATQKIIVQ